MWKHAVLFTLLATLSSGAIAINKCKGPDGRVVFQDTPCAGGGGEVIKPRDTRAADPGDIAIRRAIWSKQPATGMNHRQLEQALGRPDKVNPSLYGEVQHEQLIYEKDDATWYVYTEDGVVTSIQRREPRPRVRAPVRAAQPQNCPTPHELRGMETSASSITLGDQEKTERWRAIRETRERCGL